MRGLAHSLLRHCVDGGLPEVSPVRDGRVVHGGGVRDEGLLVHGRRRHDLRRRHLLHRLQRLLALRLVDVRRGAPVGRHLKWTMDIYLHAEHICKIRSTFSWNARDLNLKRHVSCENYSTPSSFVLTESVSELESE